MLFTEIVEATKRQRPTTGMKLHELAAYRGIEYIIKSFQAGFISAKTATAEKNRIFAEFEKEEKAFESAREYMRFHADLYRKIEVAGTAFAKDRTVENALKFHDAVYGCKLKEV